MMINQFKSPPKKKSTAARMGSGFCFRFFQSGPDGAGHVQVSLVSATAPIAIFLFLSIVALTKGYLFPVFSISSR